MHPNKYSLVKLASVLDTSQLAALSDDELRSRIEGNDKNDEILEQLGGVPGTGNTILHALLGGAIGAGSGYLLGHAIKRVAPDVNVRPGYLAAALTPSGALSGVLDARKENIQSIRDLIVLNKLNLDTNTGLLM